LRPTTVAPSKSGSGSCAKVVGGAINVDGGAFGKLSSVAFVTGVAGCSRVACSGGMNFGSSFQNEKRSFFEQKCITIKILKASKASKQATQTKAQLLACRAKRVSSANKARSANQK
jgi:hypothetical protein